MTATPIAANKTSAPLNESLSAYPAVALALASALIALLATELYTDVSAVAVAEADD